jgi:hypothetical protein
MLTESTEETEALREKICELRPVCQKAAHIDFREAHALLR